MKRQMSLENPIHVYVAAIKLASDEASILNMLAKVCFPLGKHEMATGICNMALDVLPDPELNWQAYCTRAKINVIQYVRDLERAKSGEGGLPDRQNLTAARKDLDKVLSVRPCLRTHLEMAQVYYYMGVDRFTGESTGGRSSCEQCSGEEQNAVDCFKRALELERPGSSDTTALHCLLQALLVLFMQSGVEQSTSPVLPLLTGNLGRTGGGAELARALIGRTAGAGEEAAGDCGAQQNPRGSRSSGRTL
ncbi:hypothetical protein WMY93_024556 [Mugilogobius chulae]|uniref:Tetratricopeptide repeat protein 21B n=1 Tax=Mugilogobius chulae TaxID=88201 RepID=A0AAW0NCH7_9GOBI